MSSAFIVPGLYSNHITQGIASYPVAISFLVSDRFGNARTNLSNLSWSWFDEDDASLLTTPSDSGSVETTDGSASIDFFLFNTSLTSGQFGRLLLESDDKLWTAMYRIQIP